jgi:hypothetical protein
VPYILRSAAARGDLVWACMKCARVQMVDKLILVVYSHVGNSTLGKLQQQNRTTVDRVVGALSGAPTTSAGWSRCSVQRVRRAGGGTCACLWGPVGTTQLPCDDWCGEALRWERT